MLKRLVEHFDGVTQFPIEIPTVRDQIIALGVQDTITLIDKPMDPARLKGVFYRYTTRPAVYGDPVRCTIVVYSSLLTLEWQRVVCCKELIHAFDGAAEKTKTAEEVVALVDKILGPLSDGDFGLADFMAAKDKLALYQALAVLFPDGARRQGLALLEAGRTLAEIAVASALPVDLVGLALSDRWPQLKADLLNC